MFLISLFPMFKQLDIRALYVTFSIEMGTHFVTIIYIYDCHDLQLMRQQWITTFIIIKDILINN